jgi:hypothetical protein
VNIYLPSLLETGMKHSCIVGAVPEIVLLTALAALLF